MSATHLSRFKSLRGFVGRLCLSGFVVGGFLQAASVQAGGLPSQQEGVVELNMILDGPRGQVQCLKLSNLPDQASYSVQVQSGDLTHEQEVKALGLGKFVNLSSQKELSGGVTFSVTPAEATLRVNARELSAQERDGVLQFALKPLEVAAYLEGYEAAGQRVLPSPCAVTSVQLTLKKKPQAVVAAAPSAPKADQAEVEVAPTPKSTEVPVAQVAPAPTPTPVADPEAEVGEFIKECDACPQMVVVPSGRFVMGVADGGLAGDAPATPVVISKPFAVSTHEITFDQWAACVADKACDQAQPDDEGWGRQSRPVINVSWEDAQDYVSWLSITTNRSYRLLSEAEWEYVARAGTTTPFWWGKNNKKNQANCADCSEGSSSSMTMPVGQFKANAFGLFDTVGNVWEWTQDCYSADAYGNFKQYPASNIPSKNCARVLRGGAWDLISQGATASFRFNASQKLRSNNVGLRVARDLK